MGKIISETVSKFGYWRADLGERKVLAVLWVALSFLEGATTWIAPAMGCRELNPFFSDLVSLGLPAFIAYKVIFTLLILVLLAVWHRLYLLKWVSLGVILIVAWNACQMLPLNL